MVWHAGVKLAGRVLAHMYTHHDGPVSVLPQCADRTIEPLNLSTLLHHSCVKVLPAAGQRAKKQHAAAGWLRNHQAGACRCVRAPSSRCQSQAKPSYRPTHPCRICPSHFSVLGEPVCQHTQTCAHLASSAFFASSFLLRSSCCACRSPAWKGADMCSIT